MQASDFTQGLNRYIYCVNNPLSLVDPSGYTWLSDNWKMLVASAVGIAVTVITSGAGSGLGYAIIAGAAGGAAGGMTAAMLQSNLQNYRDFFLILFDNLPNINLFLIPYFQ